MKGSHCLKPLRYKPVNALWTVESPNSLFEEVPVITLSSQFAQSKRFKV